jgi:hypothetical protein
MHARTGTDIAMSYRQTVVSAVLVVAMGVAGVVAGSGSAASVPAPGRQSRTSGVAIAGGSAYMWSVHRSENSGSGCTLSFAVRSTTKRLGALTAGHCVGTLHGGPSYVVHQTRNGSGNTTDPGVEIGAVGSGQYRFGAEGDSAFVGLGFDRTARAAVFSGGSRSHRTMPVGSVGRLHDGIRVCYSGAVSGQHCGFKVVGRPRTVKFPAGRHTYRIGHEWRATAAACPSRAGDSGSPVYTERDGIAHPVGILSGGQDHAGNCPFYFTPVKLALAQLHLRLVTAH